MNPLWPKFIKTKTEVSNEDCYLDIDRRRRAWAKCRDGGVVIYAVCSDVVKFCRNNSTCERITPPPRDHTLCSGS